MFEHTMGLTKVKQDSSRNQPHHTSLSTHHIDLGKYSLFPSSRQNFFPPPPPRVKLKLQTKTREYKVKKRSTPSESLCGNSMEEAIHFPCPSSPKTPSISNSLRLFATLRTFCQHHQVMDLTRVISVNKIRSDRFKQSLYYNQITWNVISFLECHFVF